MCQGVIIFDFDGCLIEGTEEHLVNMWTNRVQELLKIEDRADAILETQRLKHLYEESFLGIAIEAGKPNAKSWARHEADILQRRFLSEIDQHLTYCQRTDDMLNNLKLAGFKLAIISHSPRHYLLTILEHMRLLHHFQPELILGLDCTEYAHKTELKPYQILRSRLATEPNILTFMVEDTLPNLSIPHQLGMQTIWVGPASFKCQNVPHFVTRRDESALHFGENLLI